MLSIALALIAPAGGAARDLVDRSQYAGCESASDLSPVEVPVAVGGTPILDVRHGYTTHCVVVSSGGSVTIVHPDPNWVHDPTDNPSSREHHGSCFKYKRDTRGQVMYLGDTYTLEFVHAGDQLFARQQGESSWEQCHVTEWRPNGDAVIRYGCDDHHKFGAMGYIVVMQD